MKSPRISVLIATADRPALLAGCLKSLSTSRFTEAEVLILDQSRWNALLALNDQLRRGDYFICANEQQRDYWLGALSALSDDAAFPGYPYPLAAVDRLAACPGWLRADIRNQLDELLERAGVPFDVPRLNSAAASDSVR